MDTIVARYSTMIDRAKTSKECAEIEHEFIVTMLSHGISCD